MPKWFMPYWRLMRCHQPIGFLLLLWPTLWALVVATHQAPNIFISGIFVAGVLVMRSLGCVVNDISDRKFDSSVERTKTRPLAAGEISLLSAIALALVLAVLALVLVLQLNRLTFYYALIGLGLTVIYPLLKRYTFWPQFGLGLAFSWSIPMVFVATDQLLLTWHAVILFITALLWPLAYDSIYAMADYADDISIGVKSTAVLFARNTPLFIAFIQIIFTLILCVLGLVCHFSLAYYMTLLLILPCYLWQHLLIKQQTSAAYLRAFRNNGLLGGIIFLALLLAYY